MGAHHALVHFQLGLTRIALDCATAPLPVEVGPGALQAGEVVFQARQFNLQHRFLCAGAVSEDIKNDLLPVDHEDLVLGGLFPIALLGGREFIVENDNIAIMRLCFLHQFLRFARADEEFRLGFADREHALMTNPNPQGRDQFAQFIQQAAGFGDIRARQGDPDQHGPFDHFWFFFYVVHKNSGMEADMRTG